MEANVGGNEGVLFLKIGSLRLHHDQLCVLVDSLKEKPFVIALCETWLTDNDFLDFFQLDGYQKGVFKNREKRGGGVAFFVRTGVEFILQDLNSDLEYLTITIWNKLTYFNICTVYRLPNQTYSTFLENQDYLLNEL